MNIQPVLENEKVILYPLQKKDFEALYAIASDPKIWEQHPDNDRWKKEVFNTFFDIAIESKGAFKIVNRATSDIIGSTRLYNYDQQENSIFVGYTFYSVIYWGKGVNHMVKTALLNYVFQYISKVYFNIGAKNIRSQVAIERIGADKIAEVVVTYPSGVSRLNFLYEISKEKWCKMK